MKTSPLSFFLKKAFEAVMIFRKDKSAIKRALKSLLLVTPSIHLVSCIHSSKNRSDHQNFHIVAGCVILDNDLKIVKNLPGDGLCFPLDDGRWIAGYGKSLRLFSADGKLQWERSGLYHHQVNLNTDGELLVMRNQLMKDKKSSKNIRHDVVEILSMDGHLIRSLDLREVWFQNEMKRRINHTQSLFPILKNYQAFNEAEWEWTHTNTFREVPHKWQPQFGRYIVTDTGSSSCFTLNEDLNKIIWIKSFKKNTNVWALIHDCQILESGELVYYDNMSEREHGLETFSIFRLQNPNQKLEEKELLWPKIKSFHRKTTCCGGVEFTSEGLLFSTTANSSSNIWLIDKSGNQIKMSQAIDQVILHARQVPSNFMKRNLVR